MVTNRGWIPWSTPTFCGYFSWLQEGRILHPTVAMSTDFHPRHPIESSAASQVLISFKTFPVFQFWVLACPF